MMEKTQGQWKNQSKELEGQYSELTWDLEQFLFPLGRMTNLIIPRILDRVVKSCLYSMPKLALD